MVVPGVDGNTGSWSTAAGGRSRGLEDLLDAGTIVVDGQGLMTEVSPRAEELLRRSATDMLGRDAHDLLHRGSCGERLPRSRCQLRRTILGGRTGQGDQAWFERGDGSVMQVGWLVTPCRMPGPGPGVLVHFYPVSLPEAAGRESASPTASMSELDRLALLSETTTVFASTLDVQEALGQLVRLVVPLLADWVVVDLLTEEGGVQRTAVVHYREGTLVHREDLEGPMPPVPEESSMPLALALRGVSATLTGPEHYQGALDSGIALAQRDLFQAAGIHSAAVVPVRSQREAVGALTLGLAERPGSFTAADLTLIEDIGRRAGLALDNAWLFQQQRRVAETMQRHLLPTLPRVPGLEMTARYVPAPQASQVGGDWYDAFVPSEEVTALVIGDVVGHDLDAAGGMAQVCNMLRAYAWLQHEAPSAVVGRLDQAVTRIGMVPLATVVLAHVACSPDGAWRLRWTNAGHLPPLLVEHNGRARFLNGGHDILLGTGFAPARTDAIAELPPDSTLLLYTDGLIESPARSLDEGMNRLLRQAAALAQHPLNPLCDLLLHRVRPADNDDDVALLACRVSPRD
ncbi:SpoIIE family protein phosphatase [Streptomyces sp. YIM 98790]|uniref:SpoIIE family protein phosphatase n=1 Tax=Streptomyces sp. YIM 98790 TaxID=2689077 RepID=UPI00140B5AFF|nr:SpoIIE family protein phosphatase [Streptomyces sp. YIM 98790]